MTSLTQEYLDYDWLSLDLRMFDLNNGYEQIFMGVYGETPKLCISGTKHDELLLLSGLFGLFIWQRRKP